MTKATYRKRLCFRFQETAHHGREGMVTGAAPVESGEHLESSYSSRNITQAHKEVNDIEKDHELNMHGPTCPSFSSLPFIYPSLHLSTPLVFLLF